MAKTGEGARDAARPAASSAGSRRNRKDRRGRISASSGIADRDRWATRSIVADDVPARQTGGAGDRVRVDLPGGGHGDPHDRPLEAIAADIAEGYVTAEAAQALYGESVRGDGTVTR